MRNSKTRTKSIHGGAKGSGAGPAGGPGWGGSPRGASRPTFTADQQPDPAARITVEDARSLRDMALAHREKIIATWVEVMGDITQPAAARVLAADKLADRAEGKPKETVGVTLGSDPTRLSDAELALIATGKVKVQDEPQG